MKSTAELLTSKLDQIVELLDALISASTIDHDPNAMQRLAEQGIIALIPDSRWGPLDDTQRALQRDALELWTPWLEQVRLLFSSDTQKIQKEIEKAAKAVRRWIERDERDHSVPSTTDKAHEVLRKHVRPLYQALNRLISDNPRHIAVPDTNVLIRSSDLASWGSVLGTAQYTVVLVPGVLAEIDAHKINHRVEGVRDRARKISNRIKGWRNQGDLSRGIKVQGNVHVRVEGREPNFGKTLSWLDGQIADDRIIASTLELQRRQPGDRIVLITGDTVMLAKADAASIPTADTPDPDP